jgi:hypothetical protein
MRGGELAVECWDRQQMANMRGERNGECYNIRDIRFVSYWAFEAVAKGKGFGWRKWYAYEYCVECPV